MNEVWKDIKSYEGTYQVSSLGRIKRIAQSDSLGRIRSTKNGKVLKFGTPNGKYLTVRLCKNGSAHTFNIHNIVASAFLETAPCCPTCGTQLEVNHKDGNSKNNQVGNLEYLSRKDNLAASASKTQRHCRKKLSDTDVITIKNLILSKTMSQKNIAEQFGVSPQCVCDIKKGRMWNSIKVISV